MSTPLGFLKAVTGRLSAAGIPFAVTSGMACVFYGIQQTTKDVDLVLPEPGTPRLLAFFAALEKEMPPWRIAYRPVFGAPFHPDWMEHGWTSHFALWDGPGSPEHHLDIFCRPPRVAELERAAENPLYASRHVVAMMKRTDRDRDWPVVGALGWQLRDRDPARALLHAQDGALLRELWESVPEVVRDEAAQKRPLLRLLPEVRDADEWHAWLRLERTVWETVNQERYGLYELAWKAFHRRWRLDDGFLWPTTEVILTQHERVLEAARRFDLEHDPTGAVGREQLYERALRRAVVRAGSTSEKLARVQPPLREVLP